MIDGIEVRKLTKHFDERGYFMEIARLQHIDKFGQWSISYMHTGTIKAWHLHRVQSDYWFVPVGGIKAALCDLREDSATYGQINEFLMGEIYAPIVLKIPPGVAHGLKVLQGPAMLTYLTTESYNPEDELRLPYDDELIGYDWLVEVIT